MAQEKQPARATSVRVIFGRSFVTPDQSNRTIIKAIKKWYFISIGAPAVWAGVGDGEVMFLI